MELQLPCFIITIRFLSSKHFSVLQISLLLSVIWPWFGLHPTAGFTWVKSDPCEGPWMFWRFCLNIKSSQAIWKTFWWHWIQRAFFFFTQERFLFGFLLEKYSVLEFDKPAIGWEWMDLSTAMKAGIRCQK